MAEDKNESREVNWRRLLPWTELFRGFQIALDPNKLLLAAAGIVVMSFGWWLLAVVFGAGYSGTPPGWPGTYKKQAGDDDQKLNQAYAEFKADRDQWNLMHEAASLNRSDSVAVYEVEDLAQTLPEFNNVNEAVKRVGPDKSLASVLDSLVPPATDKNPPLGSLTQAKADYYKTHLGKPKPEGTLARWPWTEERGPNPYLLVTGQAGVPWEAGRFWDWLSRDQAPVLLEPLVKLVRPVVYFFSPRATFWPKVYFLLVFLWTVLTWSVFGGAVTRIAAVQVARGEKISMGEAVRFTLKRFFAYVAAPLFPLIFVFALLVFSVIFGFLHMIPLVGDIFVSGLFWIVMIVLGLVMALALVGLAVGWPLMAPTVSAEGTDSWEAVSRSFSYVFQKPWNYLWYSLVALAYGAVVIFFVGFMGSLSVYLSKWAVAQNPAVQYFERDPTYLFIYSPTSFGWRPLLLQGARTQEGGEVVVNGRVDPAAYAVYCSKLAWWNKVGAAMVTFWLGLVFLLILGFGYSYFWTAATIIYLLMRKNVDSAEIDEVYLEEDDQEPAFPAPPPAPVPPPAGKATLTMVEPPTLRTPTPPEPPPVPAAHTPAPALAPAIPEIAPVSTPVQKTETPSSPTDSTDAPPL